MWCGSMAPIAPIGPSGPGPIGNWRKKCRGSFLNDWNVMFHVWPLWNNCFYKKCDHSGLTDRISNALSMHLRLELSDPITQDARWYQVGSPFNSGWSSRYNLIYSSWFTSSRFLLSSVWRHCVSLMLICTGAHWCGYKLYLSWIHLRGQDCVILNHYNKDHFNPESIYSVCNRYRPGKLNL